MTSSHPFLRTQTGGIRIHVLPSDRFKTYSVSLYIGSKLSEETVTPYALIPFVLRRGNKDWPETTSFRERLDELYGAGFGYDVYKRGDNHIVQFRMDTVADRFIPESGNKRLLKDTINFLLMTVTDPVTSDGVFLDRYVKAEKVTVRQRLEAIINDKIRYASERLIQEMFAEDPYRLNALGTLEQLDHLDASQLFEHYSDWLASSQIDLYVSGDTSLEEVKEIVEQAWNVRRVEPVPYQIGHTRRENSSEVRRTIEQMDVNQGKLNLGYNAPVYYQEESYITALMYNGILGGYAHSKLFTNVREKASLAYYVSSRLDGFKGFMTIQSGIETSNFDKALEIIEDQVEAMRAGRISDLEIEQTKAMITNQLKEVGDSAFEMIAFDFNKVLTGADRSIEDVIETIKHVGRDDIRVIASKFSLDTIYFLKDRETGGDKG